MIHHSYPVILTLTTLFLISTVYSQKPKPKDLSGSPTQQKPIFEKAVFRGENEFKRSIKEIGEELSKSEKVVIITFVPKQLVTQISEELTYDDIANICLRLSKFYSEKREVPLNHFLLLMAETEGKTFYQEPFRKFLERLKGDGKKIGNDDSIAIGSSTFFGGELVQDVLVFESDLAEATKKAYARYLLSIWDKHIGFSVGNYEIEQKNYTRAIELLTPGAKLGSVSCAWYLAESYNYLEQRSIAKTWYQKVHDAEESPSEIKNLASERIERIDKLEELHREIAEYDREIAEVDRALKALDKVEELYNNGQLEKLTRGQRAVIEREIERNPSRFQNKDGQLSGTKVAEYARSLGYLKP